MSTTKVEWADVTINPVVGCSKCSPGCDNCYAERRAALLAKNPATSQKYQGTVDANRRWTGKINPVSNIEEEFCEWIHSHIPKKPCRLFIGSMTDLFHENGMGHPALEILLGCLACYPNHTFMLLTKRPERMKMFFTDLYRYWGVQKNIWLGVTVCNQAEAESKIPILLQTPAAIRFISVEPMLGWVDLTALPWTAIGSSAEKNALTGEVWIPGNCGESSQTLQGTKLDWIICGGETGPGARPMSYLWAFKQAEQCRSAGTPFFFKSWGEWTPAFYPPNGSYSANAGVTLPHRVGKRRSGRMLDGHEWNEVPS